MNIERGDVPQGRIARRLTGAVAPETRKRRSPMPEAVRRAQIPRTDWARMRALPWGTPLEEWTDHGVQTLTVRRGDSRHPVLFIEAGRRRYALKETSPEAAECEIRILDELRSRNCRALEAVGFVIVRGDPIEIGTVMGRPAYISGDTGYCVTRLAEHVLPQSILYRYPFTETNKRLLWSAIAELLLDLHEAGVFWGDPSLANVLMDLSDHRLTAVMADAETAQLVNGALDEGLRQQDIDAFVESLEWQAEDIRIARGLPEEQRLVTAGDADYFISRYHGLRAEREHARALYTTPLGRILEWERRAQRLNALGYGVLRLRWNVLRGTRDDTLFPAEEPDYHPHQHDLTEESPITEPDGVEFLVATLRPSWYVQRVRAMLGVRVPRSSARRIYNHIKIHKWIMSERAGHDIGTEAAVRDWFEHYHKPLLAFLESYMPSATPAATYATYAEILDFTWDMSLRENRYVPVEEGAMAYALAHTSPPAPKG